MYNHLIEKKYILHSNKPLLFMPIRNYPGGKDIGHAAKILNSLKNQLQKTPESVNVPLGVKEKLPILVPPPKKEPNYIVEKYLPLYSAQKLQIPFVINKYPSHGIPGAMTIPDHYRTQLSPEYNYAQELAKLKVRYFCIMYGGEAISNRNDILSRTEQLFSKDSLVSQGLTQVNPYPCTQHFLSHDTYHLSINKKDVLTPANMNITQDFISLTKYNEIYTIKKTHKFLFDENEDEILIIDDNNPTHIKLLTENIAVIHQIVKQPTPEILGLGLNKKVIYAIDAKLIGNPEKNLPMLSSYSSLSPEYNPIFAADRLKGQLKNQLEKLKDDPSVYIKFRRNDLGLLTDLIQEKKKGKLLEHAFSEQFNDFCIKSFKEQRAFGTFISHDMSFAPSIIAEGGVSNNYYHELKLKNPLLVDFMERDAAMHFTFEKHFPKFKDMKTYDCYYTTLEDMIYLKKYHMIDNFYNYRQILQIDDYV